MVYELLKLEIKLLLRTKRALFITIVCFLFYIGVLFLLINSKPMGNKTTFFYIVGIGIALFTYSNFLVAWEGSYFDLLMALHIPMKQYIKAKYLLHLCFVFFGVLISIPFLIVKPLIGIDVVTAFLYHTVVTIPLLIFMAQYNREKIDLINGSFIIAGINGYQYVSAFLALLPPIALYYCSSMFFQHTETLILLNVLFLCIAFCQNKLLNFLTNIFNHQKYNLLESFSK